MYVYGKLIFHSDQIQPAGWHSSARRGPIASLKNSHNLRGTQRSFTDQHKRAHQIPYHVVQESVTTHFVNKLVTFAMPRGRKNPPHITGELILSPAFGIDCRKGSEVVLPHNFNCSLFHRLFIERIRVMPHIPRKKGWTDVGSVKPVPVRLCSRRFARMKPRVNFRSLQHAHRSGQDIIQSFEPVPYRNRRFSLEGSHLCQGVHTGVGSARALRQDLFSSNPSNS